MGELASESNIRQYMLVVFVGKQLKEGGTRIKKEQEEKRCRVEKETMDIIQAIAGIATVIE